MKKGIIGLILLVGFVACDNTKPTLVTFDLSPKSFEEKIYVSGTIESANNFVIITPNISSSNLKVADVIEEGTQVKEGDTVLILEASDVLGYYDKYFEDLEKVKADLAKQVADNLLKLSQLQQSVEINRAQMAISMLDSIQIKFAPPVKQRIMELELKKAQVTEQKLNKKLVAQKKIGEQSIRQLNSRIIQAEQLVQRFQDQLDMMIITAPKAGMVIYSNSPMMIMFGGSGGGSFGGKLKKGSSVRRRMPLIDLPDLSNMQIQLNVQEGLYKRIKKGQKVRIHPDAIDSVHTTGEVKTLSMVGQVMSRESKIKSYKITVSVDSCHTELLPGLSASCEILINEVQDTIVVPTMSIFERDSNKLVYVSKGDLFSTRIIETGLSNSTETIVTSGLSGNETISLLEPPFNLIEKLKNETDR